MASTVRVRVAVAVDSEGSWCATGHDGSDAEMSENALWEISSKATVAKAVHFIEADIPLPESVTVEVEGEVER